MRKYISACVEAEQVEWLKSKIVKGDFASISHGVRYCIQHVLDESRGE